MNFNSNAPIYLQIVAEIKKQIISGQLAKGEKIKPVRELAFEMGVNPNTMQKALATLDDEKLLYTERTSGRYVTTDERVILGMRKKLTEEETRKFLNTMNEFGCEKEEIKKFLENIIQGEGTL